jgi:hypothetical protein
MPSGIIMRFRVLSWCAEDHVDKADVLFFSRKTDRNIGEAIADLLVLFEISSRINHLAVNPRHERWVVFFQNRLAKHWIIGKLLHRRKLGHTCHYRAPWLGFELFALVGAYIDKRLSCCANETKDPVPGLLGAFASRYRARSGSP